MFPNAILFHALRFIYILLDHRRNKNIRNAVFVFTMYLQFLYLQFEKKTVRKEIKVAFYIIVILLNILSYICVLKGKDETYKHFSILLTVIYLTKHIFAVHEHITCDNYLPQ